MATLYSLPPGYTSIFITSGKPRLFSGGNNSVYATVSADGYAVEVYGAAVGPCTLTYTDTNGAQTVIVRCEPAPTLGYVLMPTTGCDQKTLSNAISGGSPLHQIISPDRVRLVAD